MILEPTIDLGWKYWSPLVVGTNTDFCIKRVWNFFNKQFPLSNIVLIIAFPFLMACNIILLPLALTEASLDARGYSTFDSNTGLFMNDHTDKMVCSRPCTGPLFLQSSTPICLGSNPKVALTHISCYSKHVDFSLYDRAIIKSTY